MSVQVHSNGRVADFRILALPPTSQITSASVFLSIKWDSKSTYLTDLRRLNEIVQAKDFAQQLINECLNTTEQFYFWPSPSLVLLPVVLHTQHHHPTPQLPACLTNGRFLGMVGSSCVELSVAAKLREVQKMWTRNLLSWLHYFVIVLSSPGPNQCKEKSTI